MKDIYLQEISKSIQVLIPVIQKYNETIQVFTRAQEELNQKMKELEVIQDQFNDIESMLNETRSSMQEPLSQALTYSYYLTQEDVDTTKLIQSIRDFASKVNAEQVVTPDNLMKPLEEIQGIIEV